MVQSEYAKLVFNTSKRERFNLGGCADIYPYVPGVVKKVNKLEFDLQLEYEMMHSLWQKGFRSMPKPLAISKDKNSILMQEVQDGVPLKELMQLYEQGEISEDCAKEIIDILKQVLSDFWNTEAVHGDLHANNLLIGKNTKGAWKVWVIDFGATFFGGNNKIDQEKLKIPINHYGLSHLYF